MPDLTPYAWIAAGEAVVGTMPYWDEVGRIPRVIQGDPRGDLSECGCDDPGQSGGVVLVTAGQTFWTGDQFPNPDTQRRTMSRNCPDEWAVVVTVDFARCRPVFAADSLSRPSAAKRAEYAAALYADAWAIWTALRCAQPSWNQVIGSVLVGGWGPIERDLGPCGGFTFSYTGKVRPCEECPPSSP
jgi:hypothetical protein